jgi:peptidoglycan hydrolase CwlO-like protein
MDEQFKDRILIAMAIIIVICLTVAIGSSITAQKNKKNLHREMVLRMNAEEKLVNLTSQVDSLKDQLENTKAKLEGATKALEEQKIINKELRIDLEKTTKLKKALEEDLKEALIKIKK